jgi:hypothetical protein
MDVATYYGFVLRSVTNPGGEGGGGVVQAKRYCDVILVISKNNFYVALRNLFLLYLP